jgi:hypothetical protein
MNDHPAIFRIAFATITAAAVYLGTTWSVSAQTTATTNSSAPSGVADAPAPTLPYGVGEVLKLYQSGINKDVIINYIDSNAQGYHLSADGIIYLQNLGMPQEITKAMILRDGQLQQEQARQQYYPQQPMPPPPAAPNGYGYGAAQPPPQVVATPATPAPDVTVIGSDYPDYSVYDTGYPYYYYDGWPYYYGPGYVGGWGWGRGWGRGGGFRGGFGGFHGGFGGFHGGVGGFHGGGGGGFHGGVGGGGGHGGGGHR